MSIESKHAYRFEYLKSDKWKAVRLSALVREKGKCQICEDESISNDAHHMWYPDSVWDTEERHLIILCRSCHDFIHAVLPACKTKDEEKGREEWAKFKNAILAWRRSKLLLFFQMDSDPEVPTTFQQGESFVKAQALRDAYDRLKLYARKQEMVIRDYVNNYGESPSIESLNASNPLKPEKEKASKHFAELGPKTQLKAVVRLIEQWGNAFANSVSRVNVDIDGSDYQI